MRRTIAVMAWDSLDIRRGLDGEMSRLHECFLLDTLERASAVPDSELVVVSPSEESIACLRALCPAADRFLMLEGETYTEQVAQCFERLCEPGRAVVLVCTDNPTLPARCFELAFDILATGQVEVVFGPMNGGLYLVGMSACHPKFFEGTDWRAPGVLSRSIERTAELDLGWYVLPEWHDIVLPKDLAVLRQELFNFPVPQFARHTKEMLRTQSVIG